MFKMFFSIMIFLFFIFSCDTGNKKFKGKKIGYSKVLVFKTEKAKGFSTAYKGKLTEIDKGIEKLYLWIKKMGMFVSGPPRVLLAKIPDFKKGALVSAVISFPVSQYRGIKLYKAKNPGIKVLPFEHVSNNYLSMIYNGRVKYIEAGFIKINEWLTDNNLDKPKDILLVFEDTFKRLDKVRKIRILYRLDKKILDSIK